MYLPSSKKCLHYIVKKTHWHFLHVHIHAYKNKLNHTDYTEEEKNDVYKQALKKFY